MNEKDWIEMIYPKKTSDGECKFWIESVKLAGNIGLSPHVVRQIEKLVFENRDFLLLKFNEYHVR